MVETMNNLKFVAFGEPRLWREILNLKLRMEVFYTWRLR